MSTEAAEKAIAEIVAGLEGVTPGPWRHYRAPLRAVMTTINEIQSPTDVPVVNWRGFDDADRTKKQHTANARHIASCDPATLRLIADGFAALKAERDEARNQRDYWRGRDKAGCEIEVELTCRVEAAEAALKAELDRLAGLEAESMEAGEVIGDLRAELSTLRAELAEARRERDEAAAKEREACARLAERKKREYVEGMSAVDARLSWQDTYVFRDGPAAAAAIRARAALEANQ